LVDAIDLLLGSFEDIDTGAEMLNIAKQGRVDGLQSAIHK
jgi:hypothetical protein